MKIKIKSQTLKVKLNFVGENDDISTHPYASTKLAIVYT